MYSLIHYFPIFLKFSARHENVSRIKDNEKKCESKQYCEKVHLHRGIHQIKQYHFENKDKSLMLVCFNYCWTNVNFSLAKICWKSAVFYFSISYR